MGVHDGGVSSSGGGAARFPSSAYGEPGPPLPPLTPSPRGGRRWSRRRIAGGTLVGLWAVWVATAGWTGPWQASPEDLRVAVQEQRVASWTTQTTAPDSVLADSGFLVGKTHPGTSFSTGEPVIVVWQDRAQRQHWTDASSLPDPPTPAADPANPTSAGPAVVAWMERSGAPWHPPIQGPLITVSSLAFWLAGLLLILAAPPPRRGTRWYWFWVGGLGYGVGLVAFAVQELLSDRPAPAARHSGLRGLVTAFVGAIITTAAGGLLLHALGLA